MLRNPAKFETTIQLAIDSKTKPVGSLGMLEQLAAKVCRLQGKLRPVMERCELIVFAADHGIVKQGVSAYPQVVTRQMVLNFLNGGAASNVIARTLGIKMRVIDAGITGAAITHPHLINRRVASGTADSSQMLVMTDEKLDMAICYGKKTLSEMSCNAVCIGEMGIGNTSAAALIAHKILGLNLEDSVERRTGPDDVELADKLSKSQAVDYNCLSRRAVALNDITDPNSLLYREPVVTVFCLMPIDTRSHFIVESLRSRDEYEVTA